MSTSSGIYTFDVTDSVKVALGKLSNHHMGCSDKVPESFSNDSLKPFVFWITRAAVELGVSFHLKGLDNESICQQLHRQMDELGYDDYDQLSIRDVVIYDIGYGIVRDLSNPNKNNRYLTNIRVLDQSVAVLGGQVSDVSVSFTMEFNDDRGGLEESTGI